MCGAEGRKREEEKCERALQSRAKGEGRELKKTLSLIHIYRKDNASSKCRDVKRIAIAFCSGSVSYTHLPSFAISN